LRVARHWAASSVVLPMGLIQALSGMGSLQFLLDLGIRPKPFVAWKCRGAREVFTQSNRVVDRADADIVVAVHLVGEAFEGAGFQPTQDGVMGNPKALGRLAHEDEILLADGYDVFAAGTHLQRLLTLG